MPGYHYFFSFSTFKLPFAIDYMHVETMKTDMDLGFILENNSASNDIAVIDGCHSN